MIFLLSVSAELVSASPIGFNISGKITRTATNTVLTGMVDFRVRVLSPHGCELYSEEHLNKDLSATNGVYSFVLGLGSSATNVYSPGSPQAKASLVQVFSNSAPTVNSLVGYSASDCLSGTYTPTDGDIRRIRLEFNPGTGWTFLVPYHEIRSVPFAYHSVNSTNADRLGGILASQYIKSADLATAIPGVETDPSVQAFAKAALPNCAVGQVLRSNGTTLSCIADANGGAPPVATTTSTGVVQVGTGLLVDGSGILSVDDLAISKITGLTAALDGKLSMAALPTCAADKTMAWNSVTDTMSCLDISITAADVTDFNTAVDARISAADSGSPKLPLAGGTMTGAINLDTHNLLNTGDITMSATKSLKFGEFSQVQEDALALVAGHRGTTWYNYDLNALRFWDGTNKQRIVSSSASCSNGEVLKWNTNRWECSADVGATGANAVQIQGVDVSGTANTTGQILRFNSVSGDWEVATIQAGDLPTGIARNRLAAGTANYVVIHDGSGNLSEEAQLSVIRGGTGQSSYTDGQLLIGKSDGTLAKATITAGSGINITNGDGSITIAAAVSGIGNSASLSNGTFWIGDGSGVAQEATMSGDATISNTGVLTLKNTGTAGTSGTAQAVPRLTTDAQGRVTGVTEVTIDDNTKLPLAGGTMTGTLNMGGQDIAAVGDIVMGANKYLTLSTNGTNGTAAGQMWFDAGKIKYYDGTGTQELGVVGVGITNFNGSSATTHSLEAPTNAGTTLGWTTNAGTGAHTLNIPLASTNGVAAGLISKTDYDSFTNKVSTTLADGNILVGNNSNVATAVSMSGDATLANTGALTIANGAITNVKVSASAAIARSKLAAGTADHVLINDGSGVMSSTASLPVSLGGTGATSFTTGSFIQFNGTSLASFTCAAGEHPVWTVSGWICGKDFYSTGSATSANYVRATGGATTVAPIIDVAGSDTNITLRIQAKGSGSVQTESPLNLNNIYIERSPAEANSGASVTIPDTSNIARYVLTANTTITLPSTPSTGSTVFSLTVKIKQDGTGNRTLTWNPGAGNSIKWDGGVAAEPAAAAGEESIYQFVRFGDESVWYASQVWKEQ